MKALTETSNVEPARGDLGFAGLAEDITGNAGLPAQVDRSVFATPGELVIRRFRRRRLHRIPSRRMRLGGTSITLECFRLPSSFRTRFQGAATVFEPSSPGFAPGPWREGSRNLRSQPGKE